MPKGKRVQIYIPADLVEQWDRLPRYERSAEVAQALRAWWAVHTNTEKNTKGQDRGEDSGNIPH